MDFAFAREAAVQSLQSLLGTAKVPGVVDRLAIGISVVGEQSHIDAHLLLRWLVDDGLVRSNPELHVVAIGTVDNAYSLDLLEREGFDLLVLVSHQPQSPDATAVGEGEMTPIGVKLPARGFVFHRAVIVLKLRIALLAWLVLGAVLIEARDSRPGTVGTGLARLRIETTDEGVLLGKFGAGALQIVPAGPTSIHPQAHALVADELHHPDGLIDGGILCGIP